MLARSAATLAAIGALLVLAPAGALAVNVGGDLGALSAHPAGCPATNAGYCSLLQTQIGGKPVAIPFDGKITSFAVAVFANTPPPAKGISLDTYVPTSFGNVRVGGAGPFAVPLAPGVHRFATTVPVRTGQLVGVTLPRTAALAPICCIAARHSASATVEKWWLGLPGSVPYDGVANDELLFSVDVRRPPDTQITSVQVGAHEATFGFQALRKATGFRCALAKVGVAPSFKSCTTPKTYSSLASGDYIFRVRAFNAIGADPTPAKRSFKIG